MIAEFLGWLIFDALGELCAAAVRRARAIGAAAWRAYVGILSARVIAALGIASLAGGVHAGVLIADGRRLGWAMLIVLAGFFLGSRFAWIARVEAETPGAERRPRGSADPHERRPLPGGRRAG